MNNTDAQEHSSEQDCGGNPLTQRKSLSFADRQDLFTQPQAQNDLERQSQSNRSDKDFFADFSQSMILKLDSPDQPQQQLYRGHSETALKSGKVSLEDAALSQRLREEQQKQDFDDNLKDVAVADNLYDSDGDHSQHTNSTFCHRGNSYVGPHNILREPSLDLSKSQNSMRSIFSRPFPKPKKAPQTSPQKEPSNEQIAEYDRLVQLFIREQIEEANKPKPFNSFAGTHQRLTRLSESQPEIQIEQQQTDEEIEELIEIEQESLEEKVSGRPLPRCGSNTSNTADSNLGVFAQSQEEEFKFQFAPVFNVGGSKTASGGNGKPRLSYATNNSQESQEPGPCATFEDLEAHFCQQTLTLPAVKSGTNSPKNDEEPPFYVPRCFTDQQPSVEEQKSFNQGEGSFSLSKQMSRPDNTTTLQLDQFNLPLDDDIVIQQQATPSEAKKQPQIKSPPRNPNVKFSNFSASSLSDDRWLCPICLDIFNDAVETPCCNNLFCIDCIRQTTQCPLCNQRIVGQLKPNIPIRRLVMELSVSCTNDQCSEVVRKCDIEKHLQYCDYTQISCPNNAFCGSIMRKDLEKHVSELCHFREVACLLLCGARLPLNEIDQHIRVACLKTEIACRNKCGMKVQRGEMDHHCNTACKLEVISCPNRGDSLFEDGCPVTLKRIDMDAHKQQCGYKKVMCQYKNCMALLMVKDAETHDERCLYKVIECDNKCGAKTLRSQMQAHKDQCEFQLVKCPYYELGCKIEVLRKDFKVHLMEESFNHSLIFIKGQQLKNQEIDTLKIEMQTLRKDYDCEVQWMFLELQRVKQEMNELRQANKLKDEPRYQASNNSRLLQDLQPLQRPLSRRGQTNQQQANQNHQELHSVFGSQLLSDNLPSSANQVATSLNNFMDLPRMTVQNQSRPSGGHISQLNPLTLSQGNANANNVNNRVGVQIEEYKEDLFSREQPRQRPLRQLGLSQQSRVLQQRRVDGAGSPRHLDNSNVLYDLDFEIEENIDKITF